MTHRELRFATSSALLVTACFWGCTVPNPNYRKPVNDGGVDGSGGGGVDGSGGGGVGGSGGGGCEAGVVLRCDGTNLIRCGADGTTELSEPCSLGCSTEKVGCATVIEPSNGLAPLLDRSGSERDFDFSSATIDTDYGQVWVAGVPTEVRSETLTQDNAPTIRVFMVNSLTIGSVHVIGKNAIAIVSNEDIKINALITFDEPQVPASYNDGHCRGENGPSSGDYFSGAYRDGGDGGSGFGSKGGQGGRGTTSSGTTEGGIGGSSTGNAELVPLRGGCGFSGGGAIQLVSRTRIVIAGKVGANGLGGSSGGLGGGSGGGILLEAPVVELAKLGVIAANGGGGGGGGLCLNSTGFSRGENGRMDATPARGGAPCSGTAYGGTGAAASTNATKGDDDGTVNKSYAGGGGGGGGVGRIRINTLPLGFRAMGLISPNPSVGQLVTR